MYAIVVGYDVNNPSYIAEAFNVTDFNNIFQVSFETFLTLNSHFPNPNDNAIRIDANELGDFVIVWDDLDRNKISLIVGYAYNQFASPGFSAQTDIFGTLKEKMIVDLPHDNVGKPDVSIVSHITAKTENIFITYLDLANIEVFVDQYKYEDFWYTGPLYPIAATTITPPASNIIYNTNFNGNLIGRPRIAVPGSNGGTYFLEDAWTIVYSVDDGTYSHIHGNSRLDVIDEPHVYTDNSEPAFIINGGTVSFNNWHRNPVISYGFDPNIEVVAQIVWEGGWAEPLSTYTGTGEPTIIALSIDGTGYPGAYNCTSRNGFFEMVPTDNPYNYESINPAVAGRLTGGLSKMTVVWWDEIQQDVFQKDFEWCDESYRTPITTIPAPKCEQINALYPNPTNGPVNLRLNQWQPHTKGTLTVHDINGRMVKQAQGNKPVLENAASTLFLTLTPGMYIIRTATTTGQIWSAKVLKQ